MPDNWGLVRKIEVGITTITVTADEYGLAVFVDGAEEDPALVSWKELDDARAITGDAGA